MGTQLLQPLRYRPRYWPAIMRSMPMPRMWRQHPSSHILVNSSRPLPLRSSLASQTPMPPLTKLSPHSNRRKGLLRQAHTTSTHPRLMPAALTNICRHIFRMWSAPNRHSLTRTTSSSNPARWELPSPVARSAGIAPALRLQTSISNKIWPMRTFTAAC